MSYQILILPSAEKEINKLPIDAAKVILKKFINWQRIQDLLDIKN
jgi:mRNA-degrading endonuclease RelE of RelBE toxin-antitoxin system